MSFLAIPAVPYIITGSMSLYLSYKTYSNYCQNVDYIELERDNKIKNQEEQEHQIEKRNADDMNFVSVDEKQNVSIECVSPPSSPHPKSNGISNLENRPPTPYPYEKNEKKLSVLEIPAETPEETPEEIPAETPADIKQETQTQTEELTNQDIPDEIKLNTIEELPAREEILESPIPSEEESPESEHIQPFPVPENNVSSSTTHKKKKKRKRKRNKKNKS